MREGTPLTGPRPAVASPYIPPHCLLVHLLPYGCTIAFFNSYRVISHDDYTNYKFLTSFGYVSYPEFLTTSIDNLIAQPKAEYQFGIRIRVISNAV